MLAGIEALDGERRVELIGDDDANRLELLTLGEHRLNRLIGMGHAQLVGGLACGTRGRIGNRRDDGVGLAEACCVVLEHAACSDDADLSSHGKKGGGLEG